MADVLTEYLERFIEVGDNSFRLVFDRDDMKDEIIRLNTIEQLYEKGIKSDGSLVSDDGYAPLTILYKREDGQRFDHMTLNDSGDFFESFTVTVTPDSFIIDAQDDKGDRQLFDVYGEDVAGLTDESFDNLLLMIQDIVFEILENLKR